MAVILIAGLLYRVARWNENDTLTIQEPNETLADSSELSWNEAAQEPEEPATVAVHVSGAVAHPDRVYFLAVGARIQEAIEIAGGATEDADLAQLNLAQKIVDGQKIYVPRQGEVLQQVPTDAEKIGSMCDGAILVIRSGEITRAEVKNSIKQLERSGCKILGVVLNRATDLKNKYSKQKYYSGK